MNNSATCSKTKQNDGFEDDEIFDDSTFLANLDNSFKQTSKFFESNINDSFNKNALNVSALCCDEEISGYDKLTGKTWIYPTNYPVRDYQFNIIKAAILKNTLVSLPTGLGKTFIAAVIMYNFYRWYPLGKIVFTAPTRPLVAQQIEACYNIIAIPPKDTIEMTGHMNVNTRKAHWQSKRVFFATPQVIYNDMKSGICPCDRIRCLVIDEAHRARGNYAYCQIISTLDDMGHKIYRVLALSATPGSKVEDVINVVKSLHIAHLELRTENCIDVAPYSHARNISAVVVPLSRQLNTLRQQYVEILDGYARRLKQLNILPNNLGNLSKGRIVMLYKEFQNKGREARHAQHNYIMKDFTVLIALYHGLELLVQHGARVFLNFFDEHPEKSWIQSDDRLTALLERLRDDLGINPLSLDRSILPDGTIPEIPKNLTFGHPKFDKLKEIMINHFTRAQQNKQDTRAIVFCEYRESVNLVHCLLLQCRPLILPQMFVGQGASGKDGKTVVSQKQQLRVMKSFREGSCNALVATCVAEEGLDVGSVDLILCFDISTRSPIRLVQRCGRTGRERGGQVFILVTEGREHQTLLECMRQRDGLNKKILKSKDVENNLYKLNPRMMPQDHAPVCQKMFITVDKKQDPKEKNKEGTEKSKKGQTDLRRMLLGRPSTSTINASAKEMDNSPISEEEFKKLFPVEDLLPSRKEYWAMNKEAFKKSQFPKESDLRLTRWLEMQRTLQKTVNVDHSRDSTILSELLQYADAKRFEELASQPSPSFTEVSPYKIPLDTQNTASISPAKTKQLKNTKKAAVAKSPVKKDGDIRALFSTGTKSTKNYTKLINDLGIQNDGSIPTKLIGLLVDLNLESSNIVKKCYICQNICDCSTLQKLRKPKNSPAFLPSLKELKLPDINLIDDFDADTIAKCAKKSDDIDVNKNDESIIDKKDENFIDKKDESVIDKKDESIIDKNDESVIDERLNKSINFDLELDFIIPSDSKSVIEDEPENRNITINSGNFDLGDIEDIFADSSPEEAISKETEAILKEIEVTEQPKADKVEFHLDDSIEDVFADDEIDNTPPDSVDTKPKSNTQIPKAPKSPDIVPPVEYPLSPSILSGRIKKPLPTSPILNTQVRKFQLSTKKDRPHSSTPKSCKKQLIKESINNNVISVNENKVGSLFKDSFNDTTNKSMFTITQLVEMVNKTDGNISTQKANTSKEVPIKDNQNRSTSPILQIQLEKSPILCTQNRGNMSPILLTQTERIKASTSFNNSLATTQQMSISKRSESLIILDSDSDSDSTQIYNAKEDIQSKTKDFLIRDHLHESVNESATSSHNLNKTNTTAVSCKRKLDMNDSDPITASPYFNKKPKLNQNDNHQTLKKKLASFFKNDNTTLNCIVSPSKYFSQKENRDPQILDDVEKVDDILKKTNLSMLQMFRRDSKFDKNQINGIIKSSPTKNGLAQKRKLAFDDSEDEFVTDDKTKYRNQSTMNGDKYESTSNHKVRKKKKHNSFLETEAELSGGEDRSGDELSDDSIGSIVDFICDDTAVLHDEDIQAVYLKSIKSPFKAGAFKIPELPKKYNRQDILSQYVEEDSYEMDSFCVDSHIGLTQANEVSELELAEIILEEKRRSKKKSRRKCSQQDESPVLKPVSKPKRRQIHSDSEDDSD